MISSNEILIRKVQATDIDKLIEFFKKSYGEHTIFQNKKFLLSYFGFGNKEHEPFSNSLIGLTGDGEIVSHYGGLFYNLKVENEIVPLIWGVSAYTLSEVRGKGVNSDIVNCLINNNKINGVIGFTEKTAGFYKKNGYNIFDFERFSRFIYVIDIVKTKEILSHLKVENTRLHQIEETVNFRKTNVNGDIKIIELTENNIDQFELNFNVNVKVTTNRDLKFLKWRLFENPFIKYVVYGCIKDNSVVSYIALREENLEPYNYKVNRIIDLFGDSEMINELLNYTINQSQSKNHIYIDFSMYGTIYNNELLEQRFMKLENDEVCILPQVTAPIENRPNCEFIGLQSLSMSGIIGRLTKNDVYFTRLDSDRDRLSRINQIIKETVL